MRKCNKWICLLLAVLLVLPLLPRPVSAAAYYDESDLVNLKSTILSNATRANYVNTMMKYHILSDTDNYRVARNLQNGSSVVFFFDGCSDNMDSATYSDYTRYHLSAYCAVVQEVNGVPKIVYESENCSTIPDNPRNVSLNEGSAVPTVLDGVYNIISTNHLSRYASLRIADNSGSAPVMRCTSSSSYTSTSSAINIHARSNFNSAPTNGISSSSYSSTGCFLVGLTNNTWSEYNQFTKAVLGISNAIITTPYSSGSWTKCTTGVDKGLVIVDRKNYKTQLQKIYGGDNNHTASALVNKLTSYTDSLDVEIPDPATRPLDTAYEDFLPIHAYPIETGNIGVYDENGNLLSNRYITGSTDLCIIKKIYADGWCYVSYPSSVEADGYAEAYMPWSCFAANADPQGWTADAGSSAYARSDLSEKIGGVDQGDVCLAVDAVTGAKQIIYPVTGSGYWKMGWIPAAISEPEPEPEPEPELNPSITMKYPTLSMEDEIFINVYFEITDLPDADPADMGLLLFDSDGQSMDQATETVPGAVLNDNGYYSVRTPRIAAKNLGDTLWFAVYVRLSDGSYLYSDVKSYSPKDYALGVLAGDGDDGLKDLVVAMLNYGAEAQSYFDYRTDTLMNADLALQDQIRVQPYQSDMVSALTPVGAAQQGAYVYQGDFSKRYPTVTCDGIFLLNFYFVPTDTAEQMQLYYWTADVVDSGVTLSASNAAGIIDMTCEDGIFGGSLTNIPAKELNRPVYVAGVYDDLQGQMHSTGVLAYSIGAYCASNASGDEGTLGPLARATAVYGYYADTYFNG